jgi:hypothetical protein
MAKLSHTEKNKKMLDNMFKKDEEEIRVEETPKKSLTHSHFTCKCGMHVELFGEAEQKKCSRCLENEK